jgi:ribonuclease D
MEEFIYNITKEEINQLPVKSFDGEISVIESLEDAQVAIEELEKCDILGFDTESRPSFRKGEHHPICLLQISTNDKAFLFRVKKIGAPSGLKNILENQNISKIGLGIQKELSEINENLSVTCNGFVDLEQIAKKHKFRKRGVRALAAFFLKFRISKSAQKTNWERQELTNQQIRYAATDAWVCLKIFQEMKKQKFVKSIKENIINTTSLNN